MNEDHLPPNDPNKPDEEESPRHQRLDSSEPPNFWGMVALGILLVIVCFFLCIPFHGPAPLFLGGLVSFVSLFARGYRGLFFGFATPICLLLLLVIVVCGNNHSSI